MQFRDLPSRQSVGRFEISCSRIERSRAILGGGWSVARTKEEVPIVSTEEIVSGTIESSLWGALTRQGESVALVTQLVDIFSDIDFYSEIHKGDHFKVLVEKRFAGDDFVGYGDVLGAEFTSAGETYRAFTMTLMNALGISMRAEVRWRKCP